MEGHRKFLGGGRGVLKVKSLEAKYEANPEFPGGMGDVKQKTFHGGVWICYGTVQYYVMMKLIQDSVSV